MSLVKRRFISIFVFIFQIITKIGYNLKKGEIKSQYNLLNLHYKEVIYLLFEK